MIYSDINLTDLRNRAANKDLIPRVAGPQVVCLIDHIRAIELALRSHVHTQECFDYAANTASRASGARCIADCTKSWLETTESFEHDPPKPSPKASIRFAIGADSESGFTHGPFETLGEATAIWPDNEDHKIWRLDPARDMETAVMWWYKEGEGGEWR